MTSRQLRLVRGAAASSIATIIAAVSHALGGGAAPHPLLIVALSVFFTPIAAVLVGRRLSLTRLSVTVLLSQSIFHVLFSVLNATVTPTIATSGHHHALVLAPIGESAEVIAPDVGMLGAHLAAAVATVAILWRGENMLRSIARWVRAILRERMPQPQPDWPVPASIARTARIVVTFMSVGDVSRRGPPLLSRA